MSLQELLERRLEIRANYLKKQMEKANLKQSGKLTEVLKDYVFDNQGCLICTL